MTWPASSYSVTSTSMPPSAAASLRSFTTRPTRRTRSPCWTSRAREKAMRGPCAALYGSDSFCTRSSCRVTFLPLGMSMSSGALSPGSSTASGSISLRSSSLLSPS
jgi:hypothetical protein